MAKRELSGRRAIVTGASSGIGRHIAMELAARDVRLVVGARRWKQLESLADEINSAGGQCLPIECDVTVAANRDQLLFECQQAFGGCDILVNCAGIGAMGRFDEADSGRLRQIFEVNFFAVVELIRIAIPVLAKGHDPLIVNVGSVLGHCAAPLKSEYSASKFALHGFTDSLRAELVSRSIDVLLISPSTTDSEFFDAAIEDSTGKNWKQRGAMAPSEVARQTVRAMVRRKHEVILSMGGKLLVWLDRLAPRLANRILARYH
jgi:short-subunit dehydrogenase